MFRVSKTCFAWLVIAKLFGNFANAGAIERATVAPAGFISIATKPKQKIVRTVHEPKRSTAITNASADPDSTATQDPAPTAVQDPAQTGGDVSDTTAPTPSPGFIVGDEVVVLWVDGKHYRAKVGAKNVDGTYRVDWVGSQTYTDRVRGDHMQLLAAYIANATSDDPIATSNATSDASTTAPGATDDASAVPTANASKSSGDLLTAICLFMVSLVGGYATIWHVVPNIRQWFDSSTITAAEWSPPFEGSVEDWKEECLQIHNEYREKHGAPPLQWSEECFGEAKKCADYCQRRGQLSHQYLEGPSGRHGQNIYWSSLAGSSPTTATKGWYSEVKDYKYTRPGFKSGTGHFTQVVWAGSTHVGMAASNDGKYVVANYFPAGNMESAFKTNVFPEGTKATGAGPRT